MRAFSTKGLYSKTASRGGLIGLIHCWAQSIDPTRTQASKQVKGWNANPLPHHIDKLFLICFGVAPFARLRAMINQLAEGIRVIRPQMQCVPIGGNRCCEIASSRQRSQIVKCLGEVGPVCQRLFERRQRFVSSPFRQ